MLEGSVTSECGQTKGGVKEWLCNKGKWAVRRLSLEETRTSSANTSPMSSVRRRGSERKASRTPSPDRISGCMVLSARGARAGAQRSESSSTVTSLASQASSTASDRSPWRSFGSLSSPALIHHHPSNDKEGVLGCLVPFAVYKRTSFDVFQFAYSGMRMIPLLRAPRHLISHDGAQTVQDAYLKCMSRHASLVLSTGGHAVKFTMRDRKRQMRDGFALEESEFNMSDTMNLARTEEDDEMILPSVPIHSWMVAYEQTSDQSDCFSCLSGQEHVLSTYVGLPESISENDVGEVLEHLENAWRHSALKNKYMVVRGQTIRREYRVSDQRWIDLPAALGEDSDEDELTQTISQSFSQDSPLQQISLTSDMILSAAPAQFEVSQTCEASSSQEPDTMFKRLDSMRDLRERLAQIKSVADLAAELHEFLHG